MAVSLCHSFQSIADEVWRRIAESERLGLSYQEETITENLLFGLARDHPTSVRIRSFTKRQEAVNGSDWEWWIGNRGRWIGMRVQAKRIKLPGENFPGLQRYKAKGQNLRQIDNLLQRAWHDRLNPAYCLYIHSRKWPTLRAWPVYGGVGGGPVSPQGVLIADGHSVKATQSEALRKLTAISIPWHLMVCHCTVDQLHKRQLADATYFMLQASRNMGLGDSLDAATIMDSPELFGPVENLPDYLSELVTGETDVSRLGGIAKERDLKGFVVIDGGAE